MEDLDDTQDVDEYALPEVFFPDVGKHFSDYKGNEPVAEGGGKSNNDSYYSADVDIPYYQVQMMNVNQFNTQS